jgi:hypothetical protein
MSTSSASPRATRPPGNTPLAGYAPFPEVNLSRAAEIALKEMDAAMLAFELSRKANGIFAGTGVAQVRSREMVMSAAMVATHLHRKQTRFVRDNFPRVPYIEHPLRLALRLIRWGSTDSELLTAALLHDTVEDCSAEIVTSYFFGFSGSEAANQATALSWIRQSYSPVVAHTVGWVTNPPKPATWLSHIVSLVAGGSANVSPLLIKASDLVDNAGSLAHQYGQVPDAFIIKMVRKYTPGVKLILEALRQLKPGSLLYGPEIDGAITALVLLEGQLAALSQELNIVFDD